MNHGFSNVAFRLHPASIGWREPERLNQMMEAKKSMLTVFDPNASSVRDVIPQDNLFTAKSRDGCNSISMIPGLGVQRLVKCNWRFEGSSELYIEFICWIFQLRTATYLENQKELRTRQESSEEDIVEARNGIRRRTSRRELKTSVDNWMHRCDCTVIHNGEYYQE
jgi:hypothetical protein